MRHVPAMEANLRHWLACGCWRRCDKVQFYYLGWVLLLLRLPFQ